MKVDVVESGVICTGRLPCGDKGAERTVFICDGEGLLVEGRGSGGASGLPAADYRSPFDYVDESQLFLHTAGPSANTYPLQLHIVFKILNLLKPFDLNNDYCRRMSL